MTLLRKSTPFVLGLVFLLASAGPSPAQSQPGTAPNWSYQGENGPDNWANLSASYATCETGQRQSPIDLRRTTAGNRQSLRVEYGGTRATVVNRKRSTQVNTTGGRLTIGSTPYTLRQFHIHVPAEHTIRGNDRRPAEIHLVHQSPETSQLAVVGLLVRPGGEDNPALSPLVEGVQQGQQRTINNYNPRSLFPEDWRSSYYRYRGSLTTPPCTEGVRWIVLDTPIRASRRQLDALRNRHEGTNRPIQRRNDRRVVRVTVEE